MHWFRSGRGASDSDTNKTSGDEAEEIRSAEPISPEAKDPEPAKERDEIAAEAENDSAGGPETSEEDRTPEKAKPDGDPSPDSSDPGKSEKEGRTASLFQGFFRQNRTEGIDFDSELRFDSEDGDGVLESGVFVNSLDELEEDDIPLTAAAKEAEKVSVLEYVRRVMFWLFLGAFLVSSFLFVRNLIQKQKATKIYRDIQEEFFSSGFSFDVSEAFRTDRARTPGLEEDTEQHSIRTMTELLNGEENDFGDSAAEEGEVRVVNEELERMRAALQNLTRRNPDVYGYISVQNTNINYPVAKGKDNDFYLNHAVTGEYNPVGCVFADYRLERSITKNFNTVFYGHNITTGGSDMFHDVEKFFDAKMFYSSYVYVYTMDGIYIYEPFAVYEAAYDDEYFRVSFMTADEFIEFANECQELSQVKDSETLALVSKNFTFTEKDRILTLSTCTNGYYTQRYALHAKLVATILD